MAPAGRPRRAHDHLGVGAHDGFGTGDLAEVVRAQRRDSVGIPGRDQHRRRPDQDRAVVAAGHVCAEEGKVGVRHGIDVAPDQPRAAGPDPQPRATDRHDARLGIATRHPGEPVGLEAAAEHRPARLEAAGPGLQGDPVGARFCRGHGSTEVDRAAKSFDVPGEGFTDPAEIDDGGVR